MTSGKYLIIIHDGYCDIAIYMMISKHNISRLILSRGTKLGTRNYKVSLNLDDSKCQTSQGLRVEFVQSDRLV